MAHPPAALPWYLLDVGGPETLGRSTCLRGDLVSQGREKPNGWSQASFDRNEGEDARYSQRRTSHRPGKEARGACSRNEKEARRRASFARSSRRRPPKYSASSRVRPASWSRFFMLCWITRCAFARPSSVAFPFRRKRVQARRGAWSVPCMGRAATREPRDSSRSEQSRFPRHQHQGGGAHRRHQGEKALYRTRPVICSIGETCGARTLLFVPMVKENELIGGDRHLPPRGTALLRQAGRVGKKFSKPSRHRHREHAAAQRAAPAHR